MFWIGWMATGVVTFAAAITLYLASPNQLLVERPLPHRVLAVVGLMLLVVALLLCRQLAGSATAVFILLTLMMLLWSLGPPLIAYFRVPGVTSNE